MECSDLIRYEAAAESKPPTTFISNRTFVHSIYILLSSFSDFATGGRDGGSRVVYIMLNSSPESPPPPPPPPPVVPRINPAAIFQAPAARDLSIYVCIYVSRWLLLLGLTLCPKLHLTLQAVFF